MPIVNKLARKRDWHWDYVVATQDWHPTVRGPRVMLGIVLDAG